MKAGANLPVMHLAAFREWLGADKFVYLATPYSAHPDGLIAAFNLACDEAAMFAAAGIPVFSPVAHSHSIAMAGGIDPLSHDIWIPLDAPLMGAATCLVVVLGPGYAASKGIRLEIEIFRKRGKKMFSKGVGSDLLVELSDF